MRSKGSGSRRPLLVAAAVFAIGRGWGCGVDCGCGPTPAECEAYNQTIDWQVDLRGAELYEGDSRRGSVTPGTRSGCPDAIRSVDWTVLSPAVVSVAPVGPKNPAQDTAGDIARGWVTGLRPGEGVVGARINFSDGSTKDARPAAVQVVARERPSRRSVLVAEGAVDVTFNQFTQYGSAGPFPFTIPAAGFLDVVVDWPDFSATFSPFVYEGACLVSPCTGPRIIDGSNLRYVKPRRESARVAAGDAALAVWGVGTGTRTVRYEVLFTPE